MIPSNMTCTCFSPFDILVCRNAPAMTTVATSLLSNVSIVHVRMIPDNDVVGHKVSILSLYICRGCTVSILDSSICLLFQRHKEFECIDAFLLGKFVPVFQLEILHAINFLQLLLDGSLSPISPNSFNPLCNLNCFVKHKYSASVVTSFLFRSAAWLFLKFYVYHFYVLPKFHLEATNHKPRLIGPNVPHCQFAPTVTVIIPPPDGQKTKCSHPRNATFSYIAIWRESRFIQLPHSSSD